MEALEASGTQAGTEPEDSIQSMQSNSDGEERFIIFDCLMQINNTIILAMPVTNKVTSDYLLIDH